MKIILPLIFFLIVGCTGEIRTTTTERTVTEQLLLSTASDRAIRKYDIDSNIIGQKVAIEDKYYLSYDKEYIISNIRDHLMKYGVLVQDNAEEADFVVEMRNGGLGVYDSNFVFGFPSMPLIIGGESTTLPPLETPEVSLFSRKSSEGWCKMKIFVYDKKKKTYISHPNTLWGRSYYTQYRILGVGPFDGANDIFPQFYKDSKSKVKGWRSF